jgi:membrane-bound lytic murein transglycosylase D
MLFKGNWFWALIWIVTFHEVSGQHIVLKEPIPAQEQWAKHAARLEQSWEVMQGRVVQSPSAPQNLPTPSPEAVHQQLMAIQGQFRLDALPQALDFISFFLGPQAKSLEAVLGMAAYHGPMIDRVLTLRKMPLLLRHLPIALSAMNPGAVSEHGASGLWQLNHHVALRYGLVCNQWVDERRDVVKSTKAALHYLGDLHQLYGDWWLAVAAFVTSPPAVNSALSRSGGSKDLRILYGLLPNSLRDYIPAFAAASYVAHYQKALGFSPLSVLSPPASDHISLRIPVGFQTLSEVLKVPEAKLRELNPVCRMEMLPGLDVPVQVCVPAGYGIKFQSLQDSVYAVEGRKAVAIATDPVIPPAEAETNSTNKSTSSSVSASTTPKAAFTPPAGQVPMVYTIQPGDVLGTIAEKHGVGLNQLMAWNGLKSTKIKAGDKLTLYVPKSKSPSISPPNPTPNTPKASAPNPKTTSSGAFVWYTVKPGDNLWAISKKYPGVTDQDIMKLNGISADIKPGMKIKIPTTKP